jgi:hypothetical protein
MLFEEGTGCRVHVLGHVMTRIALQLIAVWRRRDHVRRTIYILRYLVVPPLLVLSEVLHVQCRREFEALGAKVV